MMFWLLLAALTVGMLAWIVWPLTRPQSARAERADYDAIIYYDQLQELDRDRARGLIDDTQADAARGEIQRRLLAAGRTAAQTRTPSTQRHVALAVALLVLVPITSVLIYLDLGNFGLPGQPFATREAAPTETNTVAAAARERLQEAEARTVATPDDAQAWFDLGRLRLVTGNVEGAETVLARARELDPDRGEIASAHGEALARVAKGLVTPAARAAFMSALEENEADPRARYFIALADYQSGREQAALDAWSALVNDAPPDALWLPSVIARVTDAARDLGHDPADWLPDTEPETSGPTSEDIADAQDMRDGDRQEMIRRMVERLATRLEDEPEDVAGWRMLGRSWEILGDPTEAATAYSSAIALAPNHPETLLRGAITAEESGDIDTARQHLNRLRDLIPPNNDAHRMVSEAIRRLEHEGSDR